MTIKKWDEFAEKCPWRSYLKCQVLHSAGNYGRDGCTKENCAPYYLISRLLTVKDGVSS